MVLPELVVQLLGQSEHLDQQQHLDQQVLAAVAKQDLQNLDLRKNIPNNILVWLSILQPTTCTQLAQVPGIAGLKDATGNLERASALIAGLKEQKSNHFAVFSGDDLTAIFLMLMGGHGNISVTANVAPRLMHELCVAAMSDDVKKTREIQYRLIAVHKAMFIEANPIPVKWALHQMGKISPGIRLPLTPLSEPLREPLKVALKQAGLL